MLWLLTGPGVTQITFTHVPLTRTDGMASSELTWMEAGKWREAHRYL